MKGPSGVNAFALYIHIPFCLQKCPYCDFNTYAIGTLPKSFPEEEYVSALLQEFTQAQKSSLWQYRPIQSIFFGGGTPSLLAPSSIERILKTLRTETTIQEKAEITLEGNPGTLSAETLSAFSQAGINRLSLGAQSSQEKTLKTLGRVHRHAQTEESMHWAKEAGIENVSLDLMFGIPEQTLADLEEDIETFLALGPKHLSSYSLTFEKGTPFYRSLQTGLLVPPDEESLIAMIEILNTKFSEAGFSRYEISNFALPGFQSQHNLAYWNGDDYLGLGAGAHSFCSLGRNSGRALRHANYALPKTYMSNIAEQGSALSWSEELSKKDLAFEFFFLGLRKIAGVQKTDFERQFGRRLDDIYPHLLKILSEEGLLELSEDWVRLSPRGLLLADSVIANFADPDFPEHLGEHSTTRVVHE